MVMMACWNASERTISDLKRLFKQADERFVFEGPSHLDGSTMTTVSFGWNDGE